MGLCRKRFGVHRPHWEAACGSSVDTFKSWDHLQCTRLGDFSVQALELEKIVSNNEQIYNSKEILVFQCRNKELHYLYACQVNFIPVLNVKKWRHWETVQLSISQIVDANSVHDS